MTTIAASAPGVATEYALEGSVFVAGALVQWLRDELGLVETAAETEAVAKSVPDTGGVYVVPAFTGLGAPYWDAEARGAIYGLTRGTTRAHVVRAALESLAYQVSDLAVAMEADAGVPISALNVDGGASANDFLMQFQSDVLHLSLIHISAPFPAPRRRSARGGRRACAAGRRRRLGGVWAVPVLPGHRWPCTVVELPALCAVRVFAAVDGGKGAPAVAGMREEGRTMALGPESAKDSAAEDAPRSAAECAAGGAQADVA